MSHFDEGLKLIEQYCGNAKDNVISLATIDTESSASGKPCPVVRDVDALYDQGVFYITTYAKSTKVQQIENNSEVAFSVHFEGVSGSGIGKNLGWVLRPENVVLREKLRSAFKDWYDDANNEQDENCVILAIQPTKIKIFHDHGAVQGSWTL